MFECWRDKPIGLNQLRSEKLFNGGTFKSQNEIAKLHKVYRLIRIKIIWDLLVEEIENVNKIAHTYVF
ncbi:hypothetical protein GF389_06095 [Candidatus Dojkabacteria bacterium]|nr:hypothetical protein [Candidatus Dojkabacteria bacterium]